MKIFHTIVLIALLIIWVLYSPLIYIALELSLFVSKCLAFFLSVIVGGGVGTLMFFIWSEDA